MKYPKFINKGDSISLVAPSLAMCGKWFGKRGKNAIKEFKKLGFKTKLTKTSTKRFNSLLKNVSYEDKANDLIEAFKDKETKAVWSVAGGEVMMKTLHKIDIKSLSSTPKWFLGMSDNTTLGLLLPTMCDVASIYTYNFPSMGALPYHKTQEDLLKLLQGEDIIQSSCSKLSTKKPLKPLTNSVCDKRTCWKLLNGNSLHLEGRIIGGCLDVIIELLGTEYDYMERFCKKYEKDGIILFVESCDFNLAAQMRAYDQIMHTPWFKYIKGLIIGRPLDNKKFFGVTYKEMLMEEFSKLNIPVLYDFDTGHTFPMISIINGGYALVNYKNKKGTIQFKLI